MGAWIETQACLREAALCLVAPRVGAWIETQFRFADVKDLQSHPVWVRGLKQYFKLPPLSPDEVAPRVGAWIETIGAARQAVKNRRRTPCGCVD